MYNEENSRGSIIKTLLKAVVGIILVIVFMLVLFKIFPTKQELNPLYEEIFRNNINSMKDAAETYFTNDRLPKEIGESVTMTLKEMLDLKLLLPFVDRYNKECDTEKSYVTITKTETEYELKVNLVCSKDEAYIIEHMGCNDKCALLNCNQSVSKEITEYRFVRTVTKKVVDKYTCPDGYTLKNKKCYIDKSVTDVKDATAVYKTSAEKTSAKENVTYGNWSNSVTHEYLALTEKDLVNADSCPSGYIDYGTTTIDGNSVRKCYKKENTINYGETSTQKITVATYDNGSENYVKGPEKEYESYYYSVGKVTIKTCESYNYFIDTTTNTVYSYNGGSSSVTGIDFVSCSGSCSLYPIFYTGSSENNVKSYKAIGTVDKSLTVTCNVKSETVTKYAQGKRIKSYNYKWYRKYNIQTRDKYVSYTCPNGYTLGSDNACYKNTKVIDKYTCPDGYTLNGKKCSKTYVKTESKNATKVYKTIHQNEYKWSTESKLSGWTKTKETRTSTVYVQEDGTTCSCN